MDYIKSLVPTLCCVCRNLSSYFRTAQSWKDYVGVDLFPLLIKQIRGGFSPTQQPNKKGDFHQPNKKGDFHHPNNPTKKGSFTNPIAQQKKGIFINQELHMTTERWKSFWTKKPFRSLFLWQKLLFSIERLCIISMLGSSGDYNDSSWKKKSKYLERKISKCVFPNDFFQLLFQLFFSFQMVT